MLKKYKAFSLIECLIVITIIVILTSITIPTIRFIDKKILNAELTNLYTTFNYLRQKAIASNKVLELKFNKEKNSYQYFVNSKEIFIKIYKNLEFGTLPNTLGPPSKKENLVKNPITFSENKVVFHPNGFISPGSVYIKTKNNAFMGIITCPVSQVSYIRIYST